MPILDHNCHYYSENISIGKEMDQYLKITGILSVLTFFFQIFIGLSLRLMLQKKMSKFGKWRLNSL